MSNFTDEALRACLTLKENSSQNNRLRGTRLFETNKAKAFESSAAVGNFRCIQRIGKAAKEKGKLEALLNTVDYEGRTPLHQASTNGHLKIVKYLVSQGANVDAGINAKVSLHGATPLILSCMEGHLEVIHYLLESGSDVRIQTDNGMNCASWAVFKNKADVLKSILPQYPDLVQLKLLKGRQLLHLAAWKGGLASAITILKNGGGKTIDEEDVEGNTALSLASYHGRLPMVKLLVQNGADINHVGWHQKNVIELAEWKGHADVVNLLKKYRQRAVFRPIIQ